jgi:hypothetical protein
MPEAATGLAGEATASDAETDPSGVRAVPGGKRRLPAKALGAADPGAD